MFEAYKVGISLSMTNNVSAGLMMITKDLMRTQGSVTALQAKLAEMKAVGKKAAYELGAAFTIAAPFVAAISDAARLQKEMIGIQQATGATTRQLDAMRMVIEKTAGRTMFSVIDVAKMGKTIGTGTTLTPDQISALLPEYAKFADVQLLLKGTPAQQSVKEAVKLAHTAGHYDSASLSAYLNTLTKLSMVIPGGLGEAGHALKYSQSIAKRALGIDDPEMVEMIALLSQLGFSGSRGGTNFLAAASRSIPGIFGSGLLKGKSLTALREMGMTDSKNNATFFQDGKFSTHLWMEKLSAYVAKEFASHPEAIARQDIMKHFQWALGVNGARVASLLADPQALAQLRSIDEKFKTLPSNDATQAAFADNSVYQGWENAKTNLTSLLTELGYPLLPDAETGLTKLNHGLADLIKIVHDNPETVRHLTYAFAGLAGALAFGGIVNLLKFSLIGLRVAFAPLLAILAANPVLAATAALVGLAYAVQHWKTIGPQVKTALDDIGQAGDSIAHGIADFGNVIFGVGKQFVEWVGSISPLNYVTGAAQDFGRFTTQVNRRGVAPPPSGKDVTVHTAISLDGRNIAQVVTKHQANAASRAPSSVSGFDGRMSPVPAGFY